jgi:hypothetical protein
VRKGKFGTDSEQKERGDEAQELDDKEIAL